ncbi:N-acetylglucosamine-6-phosphate deacetylase [Lacticaseibacillus jixianensis]|uniref:N-acetylglucosamine-6-phosphate deacetylase n=1 Tax=Lacticaseibacillus jixianensis TaxID=2486012 RepID=A0ABW4BAX7_9LACO|nr:N-acetylglucosamine-6-phosphate deacetylase [Lacticaseibacillus jixianensis]
MSEYIHAAKFFLPHATEVGGFLEITSGGKFGAYLPEGARPTGQVVELPGRWVAPGLVDTHIHGLLGHDVMDNDWAGIAEMSRNLVKAGVTSWLPTTLTGSFAQLKDVCTTIAAHAGEEPGAKIQGLYFEGPYFTTKHKGAQNPKYFKNPSVAEFEQWQAAANGLIRKIAIAPERAGAAAFAEHVASASTVVALGHSDATFAQAKACVDAGATVFTHTFNGMSPLSHRAPGMVGAAMALAGVCDELICDGHHVHPEVVKTLIRLVGPEHVALITDCMRAGMMPDGDYTLGEFAVYVKDGMARLKDGDSLAGSVLQLKDALVNLLRWEAATPTDIVKMATQTPAASCGIADRCGSILPGRAADYLILDDHLQLQATYLDGQVAYQRAE